jgi:hypothetical protein
VVGPVPVLLRDCWPSLREAGPVGEHQEGHLLRYGTQDLIKLMPLRCVLRYAYLYPD